MARGDHGDDDGGRSSSSEEDDGDERWRAAIRSAAAVGYIFPPKNSGTAQVENAPKGGLKLYQTKAQKLLNDMLEDSLEFVRDSSYPVSSVQMQSSECGIRLFGKAPPGIILESHGPYPRLKKKPRIIPGEDISEKSKEFKARICCAAVDGTVIIASAQKAARQSLARYEARNEDAKTAAKREEERVAELKKLRGEKWLPSYKGTKC